MLRIDPSLTKGVLYPSNSITSRQVAQLRERCLELATRRRTCILHCMKTGFLLSLASAFVLASAAKAEIPVRISCVFPVYSSPDVSSKPAADFRFEFLIDKGMGTALMLGNFATVSVGIHSGDNGWTFIEYLASGSIQTTTITDSGSAVHSRNTIIDNDLVPSQYYGSCRTIR